MRRIVPCEAESVRAALSAMRQRVSGRHMAGHACRAGSAFERGAWLKHGECGRGQVQRGSGSDGKGAGSVEAINWEEG
eukprot:364321-Chlamydomonas_euryale.AAC.2